MNQCVSINVCISIQLINYILPSKNVKQGIYLEIKIFIFEKLLSKMIFWHQMTTFKHAMIRTSTSTYFSQKRFMYMTAN